ncbi:MAG: hypothetical protein GY722_27835 [bacterium]|nr:hypothetical protein [bacterium]
MYEAVISKALKSFGLSDEEASQPEVHKALLMLADRIHSICGDRIVPDRHESLALSITRQKTAALAFDRVYRFGFIEDPVPVEIGFYGATIREIAFASTTILTIQGGF